MNPNLSCQVSKIVCISKVQNSSDFKTGNTIALQTSSDVGRGVGNGNSQASFRTIVGVYPFLKKSRNWEAGPLRLAEDGIIARALWWNTGFFGRF